MPAVRVRVKGIILRGLCDLSRGAKGGGEADLLILLSESCDVAASNFSGVQA
jgi:hypothetical protein